jgi:hypothetical protein
MRLALQPARQGIDWFLVTFTISIAVLLMLVVDSVRIGNYAKTLSFPDVSREIVVILSGTLLLMLLVRQRATVLDFLFEFVRALSEILQRSSEIVERFAVYDRNLFGHSLVFCSLLHCCIDTTEL